MLHLIAATSANPNTVMAWEGRIETTVTLLVGLIGLLRFSESKAARFVDGRVKHALKPIRREIRALRRENRHGRDPLPRTGR